MATNDRPDDTDPTDDDRITSAPIDGDGVYPFAGLTRYDEGDAMTLPENVWSDTSSMRYWAQNKVSNDFSPEAGVDRDPDPSVLPERGLHTMLPDLPRAQQAQAAWVHPRTGEVISTARHNAVINPEKAEAIKRKHSMAEGTSSAFGTAAEYLADRTDGYADQLQARIDDRGADTVARDLLDDDEYERFQNTVTGDDALFYIPTDDYTIINPQQFLDPLCEVLSERDWGDNVFGELRLNRGGGDANLDIYIDGQHVESPAFADDRNPVVVGLQVAWDFFGNRAVSACGQALDWGCVNHISRLTDREIVKHAGDVESRQDWHAWWNQILDRIEEKRDHLARVIEMASNETLDLGDLPDDIDREFRELDASPWTALYGYMDLPNYIAEQAGRRLRSEAEDAYDPSWWEVHSAATYAISRSNRLERGMDNAYDQYARRANDMLMNPASMEGRITENYEADRDDDQTTLDGEGGGTAAIENAFESVADKKDRFEEWEQEIAEMGVDV